MTIIDCYNFGVKIQISHFCDFKCDLNNALKYKNAHLVFWRRLEKPDLVSCARNNHQWPNQLNSIFRLYLIFILRKNLTSSHMLLFAEQQKLFVTQSFMEVCDFAFLLCLGCFHLYLFRLFASTSTSTTWRDKLT